MAQTGNKKRATSISSQNKTSQNASIAPTTRDVKILKEDEMDFLLIDDVKIPIISDISPFLPVGNLQLVFIGGGNIFNPTQKPLAKVTSTMLNHGTKKLGNIGFADLLESKAVEIDSQVGQSSLTIEVNFLKEYEDFAYEQLYNLLNDPNLTESTLKQVKDKLQAALMSKQTDFDYQAATLLNQNIFANTPLAYPALGNKSSEIESITLKDIKSYLQENITISRAIIVVGGDLNLQSSLQKLLPLFDSLPKGHKIDIPSYKVKTSTLKTLKKDTQQAFIYFASPLNITNLRNDGYKAQVAGFILGSSGFGSRLMEEIRVKRGLAYSAYMYPNLSRIQTSFFGHIQTALDKQDETIKLTQEIIRDFIRNGATQEELDSAKQFIIGSRPLKEETLSQRLQAKFMNYYNGLPINYKDEFIENIKNLDLKTLNEFILSHSEIANLTFSVVTNSSK
ncbi:insulinase family protein [Helicobacter muridarum]|uniref:Insulinase family protein n=2 Tax=Helicobacter muridarum TaxID=216 RepID=A0A377PX17_9HELI|nr:pitrilysin family protein [Helicobacter muridarum]TLD99772.1 insulinase family protein [Helicobacter muridarum]STQ86994.1 peptidase M16 domain-containing protein [Helicobacter muridarum]